MTSHPPVAFGPGPHVMYPVALWDAETGAGFFSWEAASIAATESLRSGITGEDPPAPMTVRALIAALSKLDGDTLVGIHSNSEEWDVDYIIGATDGVYSDVIIVQVEDPEDRDYRENGED